MRRLYQRGGAEPDRMTDARARVLDALDEYAGMPVTQSELSEAAGVTPLGGQRFGQAGRCDRGRSAT